MERRTFFTVMIGVINGLIGVVLGIPAIAYFTDPLRRSSEAPRFRVKRLADLKLNEATKAAVIGDMTDSWTRMKDVQLGSVWLVRTGEDTVNVFQTICPHLGCAVDCEAGRFRCPCHTSEFALSGDKISGPQERGMDKLETKIVDGWIEIVFKKFRTGTAEKIAVS